MTAEAPAIDATWIEQVTYDWLADPFAPPVGIHEGGTRSGKTYNICIAFAEHLVETPGLLLSIVRQTGPALKATVRRDMIEVLRRLGLYDINQHNRTDDILTIPGGSQIEFFSADDDQKVHGRKRDILWCNEANEIALDTFDQLNLRTSGRTVLDFNPSMREDHWIWTRFDGDPNVARWQSTYKDNIFLTAEQIRKIEALRDQDDWKWEVYGLGVRGIPADTIYGDVQPLHEWPEGVEYVYGLDVGYNDPMSLCRVARIDAEPKPRLLVWSLLHESYLRRAELIERMKGGLIDPSRPVYCDHDPELIAEMQRAGLYALPADKGKGSVRAGIEYVARHRVEVGGPASEVARAEWRAYRWKKVRGVVQDEPNHDDSHAPDAGRYAAFTRWGTFSNIELIL